MFGYIENALVMLSRAFFLFYQINLSHLTENFVTINRLLLQNVVFNNYLTLFFSTLRFDGSLKKSMNTSLLEFFIVKCYNSNESIWCKWSHMGF